MELNARERAVEYFLDKENKDEIRVRYERLRRAFFAPPSVENKEREKIISSIKNIVFLFLEAKMKENKLKLVDVIPKFDLSGKGTCAKVVYISMPNMTVSFYHTVSGGSI